MERASVAFEEDDLRALERIAAAEGRSVEELLRQAVHDFVSRRQADRRGWQRRFDALVARMQDRVPEGVTPDEIEADARAARTEARAERRARGR